MKSQILINITNHETRVALLEDDELVEFFVQRPFDKRIYGNIYKGIIKKIIPGLQSAFVDIGLDKNAFLHISDMEGLNPLGSFETEEPTDNITKYFRKRKMPDINSLIKEGDEILVQVIKEPINKKGPRVSTNINIPGRFLVLLLNQSTGHDYSKVAVSKKITDKDERRRLKSIVEPYTKDGIGFIIRTVSEGKKKEYLINDAKNLLKIKDKVIKEFKKVDAPKLIYKEMNLLSSVIRDLFVPTIDSVIVDDRKAYKEIIKYLDDLNSDLKNRVFYYRGDRPIFENYHIENEISKIFNRVVDLKNRASIVIEQTEALVSIDVNSAKFIRKKKSRNFIKEVNLVAAREIARQIRLRDLGGIIVIDFIDMEHEEDERDIINELKKYMKRDKAKYFIQGFSDFGLVELTRQRFGQSIQQSTSIVCPICNGLGRIDSPLTTVTKIEHWFLKAKKWIEKELGEKKFILKLNKVVYDFIIEEDLSRFVDLEKQLKFKIDLEIDNVLGINEFRVLSYKEKKNITDEF